MILYCVGVVGEPTKVLAADVSLEAAKKYVRRSERPPEELWAEGYDVPHGRICCPDEWIPLGTISGAKLLELT